MFSATGYLLLTLIISSINHRHYHHQNHGDGTRTWSGLVSVIWSGLSGLVWSQWSGLVSVVWWVMAAIRGGCLPLAIETGRYHSPKIPLSDRLCVYCSSDAVEDTTHFILFCTKYTTLRTALFNHFSKIIPNFLTLS